MKKDWTIKKLNELCEISTGKWDANHAVENGKYRFYTCASQYLMCDTKRFSGDCLIFPGNGVNVGEVYFYSGDFDAYQRTYVISNIKKELDSRFLYFNMLLNWKKLGTAKQYGSATNFIKIGNFTEYTVPLPPLEEQKRIVTMLDKKFAQIEKLKTAAEKNLQNTKHLFQAELEHEFNNKDWNIVYLEEVSKQMVSGGDAPKDHFSKEKTEKYRIPIYANAVADNGLYGYTDKATINEPSITIAARGSGTGFVSLRNDSFVPIVRLIVIIPNTELVKHEYLYYALRNINIEHNGTAIPQLTLPMIKKYCIPLPPLEEQKRIVAHLDSLSEKVHQLEEIYTKQLADCDELKQSLLQKAFEGEL